LAVPTVVALHLFRRRFKRQVVSAIFLWSAQDHTPVAGRKREPLRTSPSFWCEVLAALLLALAFAGPRAFGAGETELLVVVLDASASMGARGLDESTAERAREVVRERVDRLSQDARVTLIASGPRPSVLAGPSAFRAEALDKLAQYRPGLARHALEPAVALGMQLAGQGSVLVVTDKFAPDDWPAAVELVAIGKATANLAITHATRRRGLAADGSKVDKLQLAITSFTASDVAVPVALLVDGQQVAARELQLAAGARQHLTFEVPAGTGVVEARIPDDALAIDNVAWLAPAPPRTIAIASTLPPELARATGLASGTEGASNIDRLLDLLPDAIDPGNTALAHLVLSSEALATQGWNAVFATQGEQRKHWVGPFLMDRRHELLEGVTLDGVVWSASPELVLAGAPVISAGDTPILTETRDGARLVFTFNLDLAASSLHRTPDWPILLSNLAELRRRELPGPDRTSLSLGETFLYRAREQAQYRFEGQGIALDLAARSTLAVEDIAAPGVYRLSRDGQELCQVAYSFVDPMESDLRALASGERASQTSSATVLAGYTWMEIVLLTLALALVLLDWFVLSRAGARS